MCVNINIKKYKLLEKERLQGKQYACSPPPSDGVKICKRF